MCAEDARGEQSDGSIQEAKEQRRARHAEARREDEREEQGDGERAEVVEGEHTRDEVGKGGLFAVQHAHYQRDFHADDDAGNQHKGVQQAAERRGSEAESDKEGERGKAADDADQQLDFDEADKRVFVLELRDRKSVV